MVAIADVAEGHVRARFEERAGGGHRRGVDHDRVPAVLDSLTTSPLVTLGDDHLKIVYWHNKNATDLSLSLDYSSDLQTWSPAESRVSVLSKEDQGFRELVTLRVNQRVTLEQNGGWTYTLLLKPQGTGAEMKVATP